MNFLAELLSSRTRAEIFRLLFGVRPQRLHLRAIQRAANLAVATVRQELQRLTAMSLIETQQDGNRTYFSANRQHPLYPEIHNIVLKTSGLVEFLQAPLSHERIRAAFVFGSVAKGQEKARSDVDLMVIGAIGLRQVTKSLSGVAEQIGREINAHVLTPGEFAKRIRESDHFLTSVLSEPRLFVIGSEDELATKGRERLAARP
jgi:uncharacterized protein